MAPKYDLARDLSAQDGVVSTSPSWCVAVIPYKHKATFDRGERESFSIDGSEGAGVYVIRDDCVSLQVNYSKDSHIASMSAALLPGSFDYINKIMPGDWVFVWMANREEDIDDVVRRINLWQPCNNFNDGLKFVGRVYSLRKRASIQGAGGVLQTSYTLQAAGFSELDSVIFYQPQLARTTETSPVWMQRIGFALNEIVSSDSPDVRSTSGKIDATKMLKKLVRVLLGEGPSRNQKTVGQLTGTENKAVETPNASFLVPDIAGYLLGRTTPSTSSGHITFADLLDMVIGVQSYIQASDTENSHLSFIPDLRDPDVAFKECPRSIQGEFNPIIQPFSATPIWASLTQFLNSSINEMYAVLRVTPNGTIAPTLVARQLPFTSIAANDLDQFPVTRFLELPRWVANDTLIYESDVGRNDANRCNFVFVDGVRPPGVPLDEQAAYISNPPAIDEEDIKRSGLRMLSRTSNCLFFNIEQYRAWTTLMADIMMGQHLALSGSFVLVGVQAPICPGDNFQLGEIVYHIESVIHACQIDANGNKEFRTTLLVSHGFADENLSTKNQISGIDVVTSQFAGVTDTDHVTNTPRVVVGEE